MKQDYKAFDAIADSKKVAFNRKRKKKGFFANAKEKLDEYKAGAAQRDQEATERFNRKAKLERAKKSYKKAKGGSSGGGFLGGGGQSMFGGGMSMGSNKPASMTSQGWGVGGAMAMDKPKPKKRRAKSKKRGKVKKVVYYR